MKKANYLNLVTVFLAAVFIFLIRTWAKKSKQVTETEYRNGDIVFHTSTSSQSKAIQLATHSKYSHCGIIYFNEGRSFVLEAIQPVKLTPLNEWVDRGKDGKFQVMRLKCADEALTPKVVAKMQEEAKTMLGKNYDFYFEWSDDKIYCSELVWKIYKRGAGVELGKLQVLKDFDLSSEPVKQKMKERYGNKLPLNEKVISPAAIAASDRLITIKSF